MRETQSLDPKDLRCCVLRRAFTILVLHPVLRNYMETVYRHGIRHGTQAELRMLGSDSSVLRSITRGRDKDDRCRARNS